MSTAGSSEYGSVMRMVSDWPLDAKLAFANELIQSCRPSEPAGKTRGVSVEELELMMSAAGSDKEPYACDDDTRILEEALLDKFLR